MRRLLVVALLLSGCASQQPDGVRVLLTTHGRAIAVYGIDDDNTARKLHDLDPPEAGARVASFATSAAKDRSVCVTWSASRTLIACYERGSSSPQVVAEARGPGVLALTPDGRRIAWTERIDTWPTYDTTNVVVGDLEGERVSGIRRTTSSAKDCPAECFEGASPTSIAFAGSNRLVMSMACESDDSCDLRLLSLEDAVFLQGWSTASRVRVPRSEQGYRYYDFLGSADETTAVAVARSYALSETWLPDRAVRVDLAGGQVLEQLGVADRDRYLRQVSEGPDGVVYTTTTEPWSEEGQPEDDVRHYLRRTGEQRGSRVTGLPADTYLLRAAR